MYQPRNFEESTKIAAEGNSKYNLGNWWLGVNDINEEAKFVFDSDGTLIPFIPTWHGRNGLNGPTKDCVLVYDYSVSKWQLASCSDSTQVGTLCEYGE